MRRAWRIRTASAAALCSALLAAGCGLTSGSPLVDDVHPGSVGKGQPLKGARITVTSKEFTEQLVLGAIMGLAFKAAGAEVLDRTGIQGSIGAREAVKSGDADAMYEYTGTSWITYLGNSKPIPDAREQWEAVRAADLKEGITWLEPARLNNTYALATNRANLKKYGPKTLSDVAALSKKDPGAVTLCVESEFDSREDGLPGMRKAYGMRIPASNVTKMDGGIVYTQASKGSCTFGEVYTTDGRVKALDLTVMRDDRHFFPNYNAAPSINSKSLKKYPQMAEVLAPITKKLNNTVAQRLNAKVDVEGQDPHDVASDWLVSEGFVTD
ncbi:glycine betaine ABC transporter substrate-binding protein [Streptomyces tsukubensis]|uniref:Glycine/betaine ABC transporter substrate-binding protein n=1 Tax=Streptomyces tsukubensis TaxID=83656 RepID=A0A1V4A1W2_9ACTN|nr:glycine betaine ABC transporter substrate-binding protein [Streptomyces tsukubensis]OON72638.1 glycine/betaine ABC transporter substrate-binding protein [Streptomyces tsukubensis]QFR93857.1 glycine/betaine ABC transporter substrate-binding protein [Streptomyces tsukubensis]